MYTLFLRVITLRNSVNRTVTYPNLSHQHNLVPDLLQTVQQCANVIRDVSEVIRRVHPEFI